MDIDDLSIQAYEGILVEAEKFDHDLTLQFGLLSNCCSDEDEYLRESIKLIKSLMKRTKEELSDVFYEKVPDLKAFRMTLNRISDNIERVKQIPLATRTFDED